MSLVFKYPKSKDRSSEMRPGEPSPLSQVCHKPQLRIQVYLASGSGVRRLWLLMICWADHQRTVTMHQILEIRSSFADWLLPPPMYDDESLGDYIIHVQCLPSCREQTRNNESKPNSLIRLVSSKHTAAYSPPGTCHTSDKRAIRSVLHSNKRGGRSIESFIGSS